MIWKCVYLHGNFRKCLAAIIRFKLQEIFTTVAIVRHRYERLAVLQNVFAIILLCARKHIEKLFEETVYN